MDELGNKLIEQAGPVGAALGVAILAAGAVLARAKGWLGLGSPPKNGDPAPHGEVMAELSSINGRLSKVDARVKEIEQDLASRPTREDMHRIELSMARMDEQISALNSNVKATGAGVARIENFLLSLSGKGS